MDSLFTIEFPIIDGIALVMINKIIKIEDIAFFCRGFSNNYTSPLVHRIRSHNYGSRLTKFF